MHFAANESIIPTAFWYDHVGKTSILQNIKYQKQENSGVITTFENSTPITLILQH